MIHKSACIDPDTRIAPDVRIGAFCVIGAGVEIGNGTVIGPHVVIDGPTRIGRDNRIHAFAALGGEPQDKKYHGEPSRLEIGDRNTIREFVTFNRGTDDDQGVTRIGDDNWIMAYVHLAHDCQIGNHTIFANNAQLAGHVQVGDYAILGGFTVVHQFCHIGGHSITGMGTILFKDIPPYVTAAGHEAQPYGINSEGLKRRGFSSEALLAIKRAYKTLYKSGLTLEQAKLALAEQTLTCPEIQILTDFLAHSTRGIIR